MNVVQAVLSLIFAGVLLYVSWVDFRTKRIPNVVIVPAIVLALLTLPLTVGFRAGLLGAVIAPLPLVIARMVAGGSKMGMGDVKLAVFVGLILGYELALIGLLLGLVLALLAGLMLVLRGTHTWQSKLPFGPFFAASTLPLLLVVQLWL